MVRACGALSRWVRMVVFGAAAGAAMMIAEAASAGRASRLPYDPICSPTNAGPVVSLRPLPVGTQRMAERLVRFRETIDPGSVPFLNDRMVPILRSNLAAAVGGRQQLGIRFQLGRQLVQAGFPEEGIAQYDAMEAMMARLTGRVVGQGMSDLRMSRAIALLRVGEQENCLERHNPDSCIFPIQARGVHALQRGSRGAIAVLTEQLQSNPNDLAARWLLNVASMTVGEWPDQVPAAWRIPAKVLESEYDIQRFPDVAASLGLDLNDLAGGCVLDDMDNDDRLDVVVSTWALDGQLRYFHNEGNGRFADRTAEAGLTGLVSGLNLQQTDYNNDGWLDLWVLRGGWFGISGRMPNSLLRNNRDGTFTDVTEEAGLLSLHPTQTSTWFDYNADGWLDLFIGNETTSAADPDRSELFHNNGDGTFTEVARESGLEIARLVKGVASGDYDNDGRPDLYVSCRDSANLLFRNEGPAGTNAQGRVTWRFRNVSAAAGVDETVHSFPTWFFDYDNDGREDIFVSGYLIRGVGDVAADYLGLPSAGAKPRLYRNLGNGSFSNVTASVGLNRVCHAMGANFGDLDNDGWLDFYLATGDPDLSTLIPNRMFRNAGGTRFQEVTTSGGFGNLQKGHAVAFADLDHDGDQDVYAVIGGALAGDRYRNSLFLNPGHGHRWLKLHCVGQRSNRAAIGTRIQVTVETPAGRRRIHKTVNSGGSFGSSPLRQEIGLGDATSIVSVDLVWPASGLRQTFGPLQLNHAYRILEGESQPVELSLAPIPFPSAALPAHSATSTSAH